MICQKRQFERFTNIFFPSVQKESINVCIITVHYRGESAKSKLHLWSDTCKVLHQPITDYINTRSTNRRQDRHEVSKPCGKALSKSLTSRKRGRGLMTIWRCAMALKAFSLAMLTSAHDKWGERQEEEEKEGRKVGMMQKRNKYMLDHVALKAWIRCQYQRELSAVLEYCLRVLLKNWKEKKETMEGERGDHGNSNHRHSNQWQPLLKLHNGGERKSATLRDV